MFQEFKNFRTWLWLVVAALFDLAKRLVEHRMLVWINDHIDEQVGKHWSALRGLAIGILHSPLIFLPAVLLWIFLQAFLESQKVKSQHVDKPTALPPVSTGNIDQRASPTNIVEANPRIEIHNHPSASTSPAKVQTWIKPEHNVQFRGVSKCRTNISGEVYGADEGWPALKACFLNQPIPGRETADFNYARARVIFRSKAGDEVAEVAKAMWLGHRIGEAVHIEANGKECLLLAFFTQEGWTAPVISRGAARRRQLQLDGRALPAEELTVEIFVVDENNLALEPVQVSISLSADGHADVSKTVG